MSMAPDDSSNGDEESIITPLIAPQKSLVNSTSQVAIVGANVCPIESLDYEWVHFLSFLLFPSFGVWVLFNGFVPANAISGFGWFPFDYFPYGFLFFLICYWCGVCEKFIIYRFFVAGSLIMSSSCTIGGVVGISRYFNTWLWSGFRASWLVWLWVLLVFSITWLWRILQGRSLWSLQIWCFRAGTDFTFLLLCCSWLKSLQSFLFVLVEFDYSRNMIDVTGNREFCFWVVILWEFSL